MPDIDINPKNDREVLIQVADKVNEVDEKVDAILGNISDLCVDRDNLERECNDIKTHSKNNRSLIIALWAIIVLFIGAVIAGFTGQVS